METYFHEGGVILISVLRFLKSPLQKLLFALILSGILVLTMAVPKSFARQAGGLACFFIAALLILSVVKAIFFEVVKDSSTRRKGQKIFELCHTYLGWGIFVLICYHSLYFIFLYLWPVNQISTTYIITGILAIAPMVLVIITGLDKNIFLKNFSNLKSVYFGHIAMTILLALLIVLHINLQ